LNRRLIAEPVAAPEYETLDSLILRYLIHEALQTYVRLLLRHWTKLK